MNKNLPIALLALVALSLIVYNLPEASSTPNYLSYLKEHNKPVPSADQLLYRMNIFNEFVEKMNRHNADKSQTWQMGINQFSDLTQEEFVSKYLGDLGTPEDNVVEIKEENVNSGFNGEIDWRTRNIVTKVKNQGQCGSCWAFAATASHESYQIQKKSQPITIDLAEQQLVDCATAAPYNNHGCNGGLAANGLKYIADHGQTIQSEYSYTAKNGACKTPTGDYRPSGVDKGTGCDYMEGVLTQRPVAVRVDASNWSSYKSGVFSTCNTNTNHAVFLVGTSDSAWTIKNSWGATWGETGYIRLAKGNTCNVCYGPSFAI